MGDEKGIQIVESGLTSPVASIKQWAERRAQFNDWVNSQLKPGVDFGQIPGTDKPTLYKPGAEKILQFYGCAPRLACANRVADPSTGYMTVEYNAEAVSVQTGIVVGQGVGLCSSYESKYRYRKEWWNGSGQPTAGWERTRGGKFFRRTENPDLIDVWNTVVKMAKKRALVDLALTISGASEKFTQDMEDAQPEASQPEDPPPPQAKTQTTAQAEPPASAPPESPSEGKAAPHWIEQANVRSKFWGMCHDLGLKETEVHEALGCGHVKDFGGTMLEAKAKIDAWLAKKVEGSK